MGLKEDYEQLMREEGIPPEEWKNYFIPLEVAQTPDAADVATGDLNIGPDSDAFGAGYDEGYAAGWAAALEAHGLPPEPPPAVLEKKREGTMSQTSRPFIH